MTDRYGVIAIGSGGGGGTLSHALAPTGQRIQLLCAPSRAMAGPVPRSAGVSGDA